MPVVDPKEASQFLTHYKMTKLGAIRKVSISPKQLANWRSEGTGPSYTKEGGKIYYELSELKKFKAQVLEGGEGF